MRQFSDYTLLYNSIDGLLQKYPESNILEVRLEEELLLH